MCIFEAATGEPPFNHLSDDDVRHNLDRGVIPDQPDDIADEVWELIVWMTYADRKQRCTLREAIAKLKELADAEESVRKLPETMTCTNCFKDLPELAVSC